MTTRSRPTITWRRLSAASAAVAVSAMTLVVVGASAALAAPASAGQIAIAPAVTVQPTNVAVPTEESAVFTAAAAGIPTPTVQWERWAPNGTCGEASCTPGPDGWAVLGRGTNPTYTTDATSSLDDGALYRAVFTNSAGQVTTQPATLSVRYFDPSVTQQPADVTVASGQTATISTIVSGGPMPGVQWQRAEPGSDQFTDVGGFGYPDYIQNTLTSRSTFTTGTLTTADSGARYRAALNVFGTETYTNPATVTVTATAPSVTRQPQAVTVTYGQTASFTAAASGDPNPTVQWQRLSPSGGAFANIPGATATTYTTPVLTTADLGTRYRAVFTNSAGTAITQAPPVTVVGSAPTISGTPTPAVLGAPYDYALTAGGNPTPTVQVTAGTLPAGLSMDSTGHITGTPTKAGRSTVTVTATSTAGTASTPVTITVQPGHSGNLQFIDPPASVATGALESDQYARSFAERYNQTLTSPLTVGGTTIPAGTKVNVYYLHDDHVGSDNVAHTLTGSEWFGTKVLATATTTADLQATTPLLGNPGTTYPTSTDQGLEFDDSVTKYVDQTGINYTLNSYTASDAVRIITLAP
jgi:Putative Ig domain/Immunoglobulin I-set domain